MFSRRFAKLSGHDFDFLEFARTDAADERRIRLGPRVLTAFRASELGLALALLVGGRGLPVELVSRTAPSRIPPPVLPDGYQAWR
jgi:hypothetical protein